MMTTNQANGPFSLDDLCELANLEGDLLVIAAHEKLGIGTQPDEDGFTDNVWVIGHMAQTFAKKCGLDSLRYTHPSCKVLFDDVIALGRWVWVLSPLTVILAQVCQVIRFAWFGCFPPNGGKVSAIPSITLTILW